MKIIFITRNFPPQKGGLERASYNLYSTLLESKIEVVLLKWSGERRWFVFAAPYLLLRAIVTLLFCRVDAVYLFDGALSVLIPFLKVFGKPIVITINGLDITFDNALYQFLIPKCVKLADKVTSISRATYRECLKRKIPQEKLCIIHYGIKDELYLGRDKAKLKEELGKSLGVKFGDKRILLSVCRLVERKGILWLLETVMPQLLAQQQDFVYIIAGDGPLRKRIEAAINEKGLKERVFLAGRVSEDLLRLLYNACDLLLMPNIPVKGDIEGLGMVILEASSCKMPIIASDLEGIKDVVAPGENGFLIPAQDAKGFAMQISGLLAQDREREALGEKAREFALLNFLWKDIIKRYIALFAELAKRR